MVDGGAGGRTVSFALGMRGALLLARGRAEGLRLFDGGRAAALRSFWALAICAPAFAALRLLDWSESGWPDRPAHAACLEAMSYVIGWLGYAVLVHWLLGRVQRGRPWPLFIAAWNWCNIVQYLLLLGGAVPEMAGAPAWVAETTTLVATGWALWLEWYVTRLALEVGAALAAALVTVDFCLGLLLSVAVVALS